MEIDKIDEIEGKIDKIEGIGPFNLVSIFYQSIINLFSIFHQSLINPTNQKMDLNNLNHQYVVFFYPNCEFYFKKSLFKSH